MDSFWQAVSEFSHNPPTEIEYRLYYNEHGDPLHYTCEDLPGDYVVVSAEVYAQGRYDCRIVNGQIKYPSQIKYAKLVPGTKGTACYAKDVSIVSNTETDAKHWKLKIYEKD